MLKAVLAIGVAAFSLSGVDGQTTPDRTTEKGESSIKGVLYILPYIVKRGGVSTTSMHLCVCSCKTLGLPNDVNLDIPSFECVGTQVFLSSFTDPNLECQPYFYGPTASALASFPGIWSSAAIVEGDNNALAKWASIQPNVPDIPPKVDSCLFQHFPFTFSDRVFLIRVHFKGTSTV